MALLSDMPIHRDVKMMKKDGIWGFVHEFGHNLQFMIGKVFKNNSLAVP